MKDCVSLEIAKKLKEAGWSQDDYYGVSGKFIYDHRDDARSRAKDGELAAMYESGMLCASPTIGELLEALPTDKNFTLKRYNLYEEEPDWCACYSEGDGTLGVHKNPADALALLWMALKEKNIL